MDSFLKDLTKLKNVLEVANGVSRKKWVNYYMIDATASIKEILRYCKDWEKDFITILCTLVEVNTDESQSLLADLATLIEEGEIQGIVQVKVMVSYFLHFPQIFVKFCKFFKDLKLHLR